VFPWVYEFAVGKLGEALKSESSVYDNPLEYEDVLKVVQIVHDILPSFRHVIKAELVRDTLTNLAQLVRQFIEYLNVNKFVTLKQAAMY